MSRKARQPAWTPVDYDHGTVTALQALARGEAQAHEQTKALDWIIKNCAGTYELSFRSDADGGDRETAFSEGRRFVGMQIVKIVNLAPQVVAALRNRNG